MGALNDHVRPRISPHLYLVRLAVRIVAHNLAVAALRLDKDPGQVWKLLWLAHDGGDYELKVLKVGIFEVFLVLRLHLRHGREWDRRA